MRSKVLAILALLTVAIATGAAAQTQAPEGVTTKDARFFSEGVACYGKIFLPKGFTENAKAPAVVLAPGWGETAASVEKYAARFAVRGTVAMAIDYRGWGKSGGYIYLAEPLRFDDRLRFSQHTAKVRIRRKRLIPRDQVLDIRNAISYLQAEPGVDRARIGIWGTDMAGGHVVVVAASDPRVRATVAQVPVIEGRDAPRKTSTPSAGLRQDEVKLARMREPSSPVAAAAMSEEETKLALSEYHPFWYADQIPETTAVLFVVAEKDMKVDNEANAVAASKRLKGPTEVKVVPGATHALSTPSAFDSAADAAAAWFAKYL